MKRIFMLGFSLLTLVTFMLCIVGQQPVFAGETVNIDSAITEVTVFPDRARVVRSAVKSLMPGNYILKFAKLPYGADEDSIRVTGKGAAVLKEVNVREVRFAKIPYEKVKLLVRQLSEMDRLEQALEDREEQIDKEKEFLDDITEKLTGVTEKSEPANLDPDKWMKLVEFYSAKLKALDKELREIKKQQGELGEKKQQAEWKLNGIDDLKEKKRIQVTAKITVKKQGKLSFNLVYMIEGPQWTPVYELHADTQNDRMKIKYDAFIKQKTGEDWTGVKLNLSTAKPGIGAKHPDLKNWTIQFRPPAEKKKPKGSGVNIRDIRATSNQQNMFVPERRSIPLNPEKEDDDEMEEEIASVQAGATSVVFTIQGKSTVKSSKSKHRVSIGSHNFPVFFRYSTAPKLQKYAYLKARTINKSPYPFLPGESTIFLDNTYVTKSWLKKVAVDQEFWTFLGVDEGISVDYKIIDPFRQDKGVFKKKNKLVYKRFITIKYHKKKERELVVWDQMPLSKDEDIKVELINPRVNGKRKDLVLTKRGFLEWLFKPKSGDKIEIPIQFTVQYPREKAIKGHTGF